MATRNNSATDREPRRSSVHLRGVTRKIDSAPFKGARREILFPTEPSTIGHRKIDEAIERVVSRKK